MKRLYLHRAFVAFLFAGFVIGSAHGEPQENTLLSAAKTASDKENIRELQALEPKALAASGADADRSGDELRLHLTSGALKSYKNSPECKDEGRESKCQKYTLIAHARSRSLFVIAKFYYESVEYLLVGDDRGEETTLRDFPTFSPTGNHLLVLLMNDEQIGFAVQVWRREGDKFVVDWSGSPDVVGIYTSYKLVRWASEDRIELSAENSFAPPKADLKKHFELRHSTRGWRVVELH